FLRKPGLALLTSAPEPLSAALSPQCQRRQLINNFQCISLLSTWIKKQECKRSNAPIEKKSLTPVLLSPIIADDDEPKEANLSGIEKICSTVTLYHNRWANPEEENVVLN
ncbi:MAG TPA: hypothetical protein VFN23_03140, partial [Ktedonobacteraceae bacterium]|nr:hypothetical protein [Ktedonobacteraceae bacterium]